MQQEIWFGKYRIIRLLGSGGTARVYLVKHILLDSYRAIKCISNKNPLYEQLKNEALLLKNLKHSCIPIIYDIEEDEEGSYIVEQYLEGENLKNQLQAEGPLSEKKLLYYALQLCDLILYLHHSERPILYVDLKPDNIIISGAMLKLIDFGSALYQDELEENPGYFATRGYAAPELYRLGQIDERCDVYGIGMLLLAMATGYKLSENQNQPQTIELGRQYSRQLNNIIHQCLRPHPEQRYATVEQLKNALEEVKQKYYALEETSHGFTIAIAGTQARIGVTHFAFRLCSYLGKHHLPCVYLEKNGSSCTRRIWNCLGNPEAVDGILKYEGILMQWKDYGEGSEYPVKIMDYGRLSEHNLEGYLEADLRLLVTGAKDWELAGSEQVLKNIAEYKDIIYLFNFLNGKQFSQVVKNMEGRKCCRIPYEPDPFAGFSDSNSRELFDEILEGYLTQPKITVGRSLKRLWKGLPTLGKPLLGKE